MSENGVSRRYEFIVVVLLSLAFGFEFLDRLAMSFLLPIIQPELNITNAQIGLLGFINTGCYSLSAIVFGYIQDKTGGRKKWLVFWLFATFVATAVTAMVSSFGQLFVVRAFVGIVEGPLLGLFGVILIHTNPKNFGRNMGITNSAVALIAVTLGPIAVTQMVRFFSWQSTYFLVAVPTLIIAILCAIFIKEVHIDPEEAIKQKQQLVQAGGVMSLFKNKNIIVCIFFSIALFGGYWTMMLFAPLYLVNVTGYSVQQMGFISSTMGIIFIIHCTLIPKLSDVFGRKPILIIASVCAVMPPLLMAVFPGSLISTIAYVLLAGTMAALPPVISNVVPMESVVEYLRTTANGVISGLGEFLGGSCMPVVVGRVADSQGLQATMGVGAALLFLNIIFGALLKETNPVVLAKQAEKQKQQQAGA
ncbi:MAG: MFS transporter [Desulfitobacteriia bacterium]|jgi:MFS family permease